jgi:hypothetical protein
MENYNRVERNFWATFYYLNDKLHRIDGPAIECNNGDKEWYENGLRHRIGAPAIEHISGTKEWWQNGKLHRTDGPAREFFDGDKHWWFEDEFIDCKSQKEFERIIKLKLFW